MNCIQSWIKSIRLKTLPLALSNTLMGSALAASDSDFKWTVFVLAALTTLLLQILSNLANDYGDFVNGKDTAERIGPKRMVQSGEITPKAMLSGIIVVAAMTLVVGAALILTGTQGLDSGKLIGFGLLGLAAIVAAIRYTVGRNPYGYRGLGDLFVFLFFGWVGVIGTYFLHTQSVSPWLLLPASAMGMLSTGVLNMNNMRDYHADTNAGKRTMVVLMGVPMAKAYHTILVIGALFLASLYVYIHAESPLQWIFLLTVPLFLSHIKRVNKHTEALQLAPELGKLAFFTLLFAFLYGIALVLW